MFKKLILLIGFVAFGSGNPAPAYVAPAVVSGYPNPVYTSYGTPVIAYNSASALIHSPIVPTAAPSAKYSAPLISSYYSTNLPGSGVYYPNFLN